MSQGRVYLVGAGPGAPGLITVRGRQLLGEADVVVFDMLASSSLLRYARAGAERINAGKRAGDHAMAQEEINALLVERARAGRKVVRLKGGDPFLFGRGAEEAEALERAGIPYEIVPGISSVHSAPAYGGISLTRRGVSSSALIFAARTAGAREEVEDWRRAAGLGGTLVFLMGFARLGEICAALLEGGMAPRTPVAVIQWGATVRQKRILSRLDEAPKAAAEGGLGSPALIVVGEVASANLNIPWTRWLPLFGKTVAFTRGGPGVIPWLEACEGLGAQGLEFPLVRSREAAGTDADEAVYEALAGFDWIVFANSLGVEIFFQRLLRRGLDARSLAGVRIASIGPFTTRALAERGIQPDLIPQAIGQDGIARELPVKPGSRVLLPGAVRGRGALRRHLSEEGVEAVPLPLYEASRDAGGTESLCAALRAGEIDNIVFSSPLEARFLRESAGEAGLRGLLSGVRAICLGRQAAQELEAFSRAPDVVLSEPTLEALLQALSLPPQEG